MTTFAEVLIPTTDNPLSRLNIKTLNITCNTYNTIMVANIIATTIVSTTIFKTITHILRIAVKNYITDTAILQ